MTIHDKLDAAFNGETTLKNQNNMIDSRDKDSSLDRLTSDVATDIFLGPYGTRTSRGAKDSISKMKRLLDRSVGFDRIFDSIFHDIPSQPRYPPYNIHKTKEGYLIEIALAGFSKNDIDLYREGQYLVVEGELSNGNSYKDREDISIKHREDDPPDSTNGQNRTNSHEQTIHQGIAERSFKNMWRIADNIEINEASFENGLLKIWLKDKDKNHSERISIDIK